MDLHVAGGVLRRQAERVPAHRMQDVEALGALIAGDDIAHRIVAHMAHMDAPRRIREHLQDVIFRAGFIDRGDEAIPGGPSRLPFAFCFQEIISRHVLRFSDFF